MLCNRTAETCRIGPRAKHSTGQRPRGVSPGVTATSTPRRSGPDSLKPMCSDMGYEVVTDIHSLPERLPALYRRLTV